jgi:hypothetical protein
MVLCLFRATMMGNDRYPGQVLFCKMDPSGTMEKRTYIFRQCTVWTGEWCTTSPEYVCIGK